MKWIRLQSRCSKNAFTVSELEEVNVAKARLDRFDNNR